jgi:carboxypeptidase Q
MRFARRLIAPVAMLAVPLVLSAQAPDRLDYQMLGRIREEGMQRSQVMDIISWLSDVKGPRLTASPGFNQAGDWTIETLKKWGLSNVRYERWPFGRGWSLERFSAHMIEPQIQPLIGYPKAWSPGTGGVVTGEVVQVLINTPADFDKYRGKLKGKIVLPQTERAVRMLEGKIVLKMGEKDFEEAESTPIPGATGGPRFPTPAVAPAQLNKFYLDEGVVAVFDRGSDSDMSAGGSELSWQTQRVDGGTVFVGSGGSRDPNAAPVPVQVTLAVEHYNRMIRILQKGVPVKVELDLRVKFHDEGATPNGFNILAEIPGTDPRLKDEIVLIGGHFDSWHAGTGATDNATGSAAMMEALRILKTLGVNPRRTIRIALWGAEEQGLLGSRHYVRTHIADGDRRMPEYDKHSAYFNIDNGTGKIRGIWAQQNFGVQPIFQQWITPLKDLGVTTVGPRAVTSTDHLPFDAAGIPGFQFMQERLEYNSRTHHSNMDVVDRVQRDDMVQMASVVAWFAYNAAMRDEKLPRKAPPTPRVAQ